MVSNLRFMVNEAEACFRVEKLVDLNDWLREKRSMFFDSGLPL